MPARRDEHGRVVEEDTQVTRRSEEPVPASDHIGSGAGTELTRLSSARAPAVERPAANAPRDYDEPTRVVSRPRRHSPVQDDATVLRRPKRERSDGTGDTAGMADPVTGWLVVVGGPGKGRSLQLGLGRNEVGRAATAKVCLDFGDKEISRNAHAFVTYDDEARDWYVHQGGGRNLVRLNGHPVLEAAALPPRSEIRIGATTLLFVPLCGEHFSWDDMAE